jgi:hypothetical protein
MVARPRYEDIQKRKKELAEKERLIISRVTAQGRKDLTRADIVVGAMLRFQAQTNADKKQYRNNLIKGSRRGIATSSQRYGLMSWLFELRPRALWIIAPPPPSRYATTNRRVCLVLIPRIAAAEIPVRRFARTSERISMRRSSCPLMLKRSNLRLRHLTKG